MSVWGARGLRYEIYTHEYVYMHICTHTRQRSHGGGSSLNLLIYWIFLESSMPLFDIDFIGFFDFLEY